MKWQTLFTLPALLVLTVGGLTMTAGCETEVNETPRTNLDGPATGTGTEYDSTEVENDSLEIDRDPDLEPNEAME